MIKSTEGVVPPSYDVIGALTYPSEGRSLFRNKLSCRGRSVPLEILQPRSQRRDFVRQRYKNEARRTAYSGDGCDRPSDFLRFIIYLLMASQLPIEVANAPHDATPCAGNLLAKNTRP